MALLELQAPDGLLTLLDSSDVRARVDAARERSSSPQARPARVDSEGIAHMADQMGISERALRAARGMLVRHVAIAGEVLATTLTATVDGPHRARLAGPALVARSDDEDLKVGVALLADPLVLLVVGGLERALHWTLMPGGPSVGARADGLRLLRALAAGGELTFTSRADDGFPPLELGGGTWNDEDVGEWRLFEDLAALEEWSGETLTVPTAVSAREATVAAQAARWVRSQQVCAQISGPIRFVADSVLDDGKSIELRLHQAVEIDLLGIQLPLGEGVARVALERVEPDDAAADRGFPYVAFPAQPELRFWLTAPPGRRRPPRRTQRRHTSAPPQRRPRESLDVSFVREAKRSLADVLRDDVVGVHAQHHHGTAGLLDDIRGR